ncbi:hypothetical protein NAT51_08190 [Flavobacterium amniphilum]|uniref:hypothetical protein n=1 Tax=Flavobacterium amniphilum TaxID=1834035 RepID=UPI002029BD31|nr:hypothetical protein [Flavobacterium amniphilum]MCL9805498.1 hypothetical protein [Flavobacterium amniphilum]
MRILLTLLLLTTLLNCSGKQKEDAVSTPKTIKHDDITAIDAEFPLRLDRVNLQDNKHTFHLNDGIVSKIDETIRKNAEETGLHDNPETYRKTYINTIQLQGKSHTVFVVLLKSYPIGEEVGAKVLFYDNQKKEFADKDFELKLFALYSYDNGKLKPTDLKTGLQITYPEIDITDFNKDGIQDFKFKRLYHNGTFNALHTTILAIKNKTIDTLYFCEKGFGELAEKRNCL